MVADILGSGGIEPVMIGHAPGRRRSIERQPHEVFGRRFFEPKTRIVLEAELSGYQLATAQLGSSPSDGLSLAKPIASRRDLAAVRQRLPPSIETLPRLVTR
jgi:hypothetical protein